MLRPKANEGDTVKAIYVMLSLSCLWVLLIGCSQMTLKSFQDAEARYYKEYMGTNVAAAEAALLEYRRMILEYRAAGVKGVSFDVTLAAASARLYAMYEFLGDNRKAEIYLAESVACFRRSHGKTGHGVTPEERDEVDRFLLNLGANKVPWRKQALRMTATSIAKVAAER